jgi:hypothetical protein
MAGTGLDEASGVVGAEKVDDVVVVVFGDVTGSLVSRNNTGLEEY